MKISPYTIYLKMQPNALLIRQNFIICKKWVLHGAEKSLMHFWQPSVWVRVAVVIPEICRQSLERGMQKILVRKALSETSLLEILDLNGNWPINQIQSCNSQ
jgi:hypothetical protein